MALQTPPGSITSVPHSQDPEGSYQEALKDPSHPLLFYHIFTSESHDDPAVFALTLSEERPAHVRSKAVIGWLPASTGGEGEESGLNDFKENCTSFHTLPYFTQ